MHLKYHDYKNIVQSTSQNARPMIMKNLPVSLILILLFSGTLMAQSSMPGAEAVGRWNLTIEMDDGSYPGWLEITGSGFQTLTGSFVGYEGSARPVSHIAYNAETGTYSFAIPPQWKDPGSDLMFAFQLDGDMLEGMIDIGEERLSWTGVRAPDLVRETPPIWGAPHSLLDDDMSRWIIPENNRFRMVDGILVNEDVGGNLISKETFDDFKIHATFRYPEGSNSGIYLRGRYEVQIMDNYGEPPSNLILGGIYGFIEPSVNAARKAGEWQTMDVTLVGRYVTVVLNGVAIIINRPIPGTTGGALDSNEGLPGPVMIQGDHGPVEFKKLIVTPAMNR